MVRSIHRLVEAGFIKQVGGKALCVKCERSSKLLHKGWQFDNKSGCAIIRHYKIKHGITIKRDSTRNLTRKTSLRKREPSQSSTDLNFGGDSSTATEFGTTFMTSPEFVFVPPPAESLAFMSPVLNEFSGFDKNSKHDKHLVTISTPNKTSTALEPMKSEFEPVGDFETTLPASLDLSMSASQVSIELQPSDEINPSSYFDTLQTSADSDAAEAKLTSASSNSFNWDASSLLPPTTMTPTAELFDAGTTLDALLLSSFMSAHDSSLSIGNAEVPMTTKTDSLHLDLDKKLLLTPLLHSLNTPQCKSQFLLPQNQPQHEPQPALMPFLTPSPLNTPILNSAPISTNYVYGPTSLTESHPPPNPNLLNHFGPVSNPPSTCSLTSSSTLTVPSRPGSLHPPHDRLPSSRASSLSSTATAASQLFLPHSACSSALNSPVTGPANETHHNASFAMLPPPSNSMAPSSSGTTTTTRRTSVVTKLDNMAAPHSTHIDSSYQPRMLFEDSMKLVEGPKSLSSSNNILETLDEEMEEMELVKLQELIMGNWNAFSHDDGL